MKSILSKTYSFFAGNIWALFLLWSLWLTLEYYVLGVYSYVRIFDHADSGFSLQISFIKGFLKNGFTSWFPYAVGGIDSLTQEWLNIARIDSLFFAIFPYWLPNGLITFLQSFLAGYFTYRLCKDYLKLDSLPSILAGLVYGLFPVNFTIDYFTQLFSVAGFPFILWSLEYISEKKGNRKYILAIFLGLLIASSISLPLGMPFVLPLALAWFVFVRRRYSFQFLSLFALFSVALLVSKINSVFSLLLNVPFSHRVDMEFAYPLVGNPWNHAFGEVESFVRHNLIYLLLGTAGLFFSRFKERSLWIIMLLLVFCGAVSPLWFPLNPYISPYLGLFKSFQVDLFFFWAPFFAVLSAAYGLHILQRIKIPLIKSFSKNTGYNLGSVLCIAGISILMWHSLGVKYRHTIDWTQGNSYAIIYENADLKSLAAQTEGGPVRVATVADQLFHPTFQSAYGLEAADSEVSLYPKTYKDFWEKVVEPLTAKDRYLYNYLHYWGHRVYLFSPSYYTYEKIEVLPFSDYYNLNLLSLANTKYIVSRIPVSHENLKLRPATVTGIEVDPKEPTSFKKALKVIQRNIRGRRLYIYENEKYFPRFFIADNARVFADSGRLLEEMAGADTDTLRNYVFIEEKFVSDRNILELGRNPPPAAAGPPGGQADAPARGEVKIKLYSPDSIVLSAKLDKPGILVVTNNFSRYWEGKVDGVKKEIVPAYHAFMGIFLEKGEHEVELNYSPPYLPF